MTDLNREAWLTQLADAFCLPLIGSHFQGPVPKYRVSCGFPKGRGGRGVTRIGECWSPSLSQDGATELFISPVLADAAEVAHVLLHECVHLTVGNACGHKGDFRKTAKAVGLEGKMTATVPGEALQATIQGWLQSLPPYPHGALKPSAAEAGPGSRMLKLACACGFTVRSSNKWVEAIGGQFPCPACHDGDAVLQ